MRRLALAALLLGACEPAWKPYHSSDGGFQVLMPGEPKLEAQVVATAAGPVSAHFVTAEGVGSAKSFAVIYNDYPAGLMNASAARILDGARDGAVKTVAGRLLAERPITLAGHPGREMQIGLSGGGSIVARLYLVKNRLYQANVEVRRDDVSPAAKRFLESFVLD
jgi:hypothetical protein